MEKDSCREIAIFAEALELSLREREDFVRHRCGGQVGLRRKVEALLGVYDRIGRLLEQEELELLANERDGLRGGGWRS